MNASPQTLPEPVHALFNRVLHQPQCAAALRPGDWSRLLQFAHRTKLFPHLSRRLSTHSIFAHLPSEVQHRLQAGCLVAAAHERGMHFEVNRVQRALVPLQVPVVLLKGAAYALAGLPNAAGRVVNDVDILVPKARLAEVENALLACGWEPVGDDKYDDHYYREWMHELPPLAHRDRRTVIDVHHTILPPTGRVHPDANSLLAHARPLDTPGLAVLAPADMVLHASAHMFQDGDIASSYRDLVDLDLMLRHFGEVESGFWEQLVPRAKELQLARPLFYAARYTSSILGTPLPENTQRALDACGPSAPVRRAMDALVRRVLLPEDGDTPNDEPGLSRLLLYIRSHWLRMPPWPLAKHLARKAIRSCWKEDRS